jgi:hypothetical protein
MTQSAPSAQHRVGVGMHRRARGSVTSLHHARFDRERATCVCWRCPPQVANNNKRCQKGEIDIVLGKALLILGQAEQGEPFRDRRHPRCALIRSCRGSIVPLWWGEATGGGSARCSRPLPTAGGMADPGEQDLGAALNGPRIAPGHPRMRFPGWRARLSTHQVSQRALSRS